MIGLILLVVGGVLVYLLFANGITYNCTLCGNQLGRRVYYETVDGRAHTLCAHCGIAIERKRSRDARGR